MITGGVLIIGSLLWDQSQRRISWRSRCLEIHNQILVKAPIRYGRISKSRNCTFTMIFSSESNKLDLLGQAVFVPFINNPINHENLDYQCQELMKSEREKNNISSKLDWDWGALAICINPEALNNHEKNIQLQEIINNWSKKYSEIFLPDDYRLGQETPVINERGFLDLTWPSQLQNYDFLIATVTKPNVEVYPTAKKIADRIIVNEHSEYFDKNLEHNITTFQDVEIRNLLNIKL